MQNENSKDKNGQVIMGRFFSNKEMLWNGIVFLLLGVAYDVFEIAPQLPDGWKTDASVSLENIEHGWFIQMFFIFISYLLLSRLLFGRDVDAVKKLGYIYHFSRKFSLMIGLIFLNLVLKSIILITLF